MKIEPLYLLSPIPPLILFLVLWIFTDWIFSLIISFILWIFLLRFARWVIKGYWTSPSEKAFNDMYWNYMLHANLQN